MAYLFNGILKLEYYQTDHAIIDTILGMYVLMFSMY